MAERPLATPADAARFNKGVVSEAALLVASARVRGFTHQQFFTNTDTIRTRGGRLVPLPGKPLQAIVSVVDSYGNPVSWQERSNGAIFVGQAGNLQSDQVDITYRSGWDTLSDDIIELVCSVAKRLQDLNPALEEGAVSETGGSEGMTFGWDSYQGVGDLVTSEKTRIARFFPKVPRAIVLSA